MSTRTLLTCGIVAGPLFVAVWAVQAATRDGFDPRRHPLSLLALGNGGWAQIANFVGTGALFVACAVGVWRALRADPTVRRGRVAAPLAIGGLGAGLIVAGVFATDPGAGFPAGAPAGAPAETTLSGALHGAGAMLAFVGMAIGCLVLARRFALLGHRAWAVASVAVAVSTLVLSAPGPGWHPVRLVLASAILFGYVGAFAAHAGRGPVTVSKRTAAAAVTRP